MKRKLSLFLIAFGAFIVIYPVIFLLAGSFMHPAELEEHLAPIVSPASQGFADWSLLPQIQTLRSYAKVLLEEPPQAARPRAAAETPAAFRKLRREIIFFIISSPSY